MITKYHQAHQGSLLFLLRSDSACLFDDDNTSTLFLPLLSRILTFSFHSHLKRAFFLVEISAPKVFSSN